MPLIYYAIAIYVPATNMPLKCHIQSIYHICQLLQVHIWDNYVNLYTSYELTAIDSVTAGTGIFSVHIIGIYPWTNMLPTVYMYVPLHFYCSVHLDPTLLDTSIKNQ